MYFLLVGSAVSAAGGVFCFSWVISMFLSKQYYDIFGELSLIVFDGVEYLMELFFINFFLADGFGGIGAWVDTFLVCLLDSVWEIEEIDEIFKVDLEFYFVDEALSGFRLSFEQIGVWNLLIDWLDVVLI